MLLLLLLLFLQASPSSLLRQLSAEKVRYLRRYKRSQLPVN